MDQPRSALSVRIFSMLTSAAPGSTWMSRSGNFFLTTSAVAAAMGIHEPPVGPEVKVRLTFCASAGRGRSRARARAKTIQRVVRIGLILLPPPPPPPPGGGGGGGG